MIIFVPLSMAFRLSAACSPFCCLPLFPTGSSPWWYIENELLERYRFHACASCDELRTYFAFNRKSATSLSRSQVSDGSGNDAMFTAGLQRLDHIRVVPLAAMPTTTSCSFIIGFEIQPSCVLLSSRISTAWRG